MDIEQIIKVVVMNNIKLVMYTWYTYQKIVIGIVFALLFSSAYAKDYPKDYPNWAKQNGWVSLEEVCHFMNKSKGIDTDCTSVVPVTGTSIMSSWAGDPMDMYYDEGSNSITRVRIRITWTTDRSPYSCGQIIILRPDETQNFTKRSLAMRECN